MYSVFIDDSERERRLQLTAAVIIPADKFRHVERDFGHLIQTELSAYPEVTNHPHFEFHAAAIWNHNDAWKTFPHERVDHIFHGAARAIETIGRECITYGVIDISKYPRDQPGKIARQVDAFEACAYSIADWFRNNAPGEFGTLTADGCNRDIRDAIKEKFRDLRPKAMSSPIVYGVLNCIADSISFSDSRDSLGVQLADICGWLIGRQLNGGSTHRDTQLFRRIEKFIYRPKCVRFGEIA